MDWVKDFAELQKALNNYFDFYYDDQFDKATKEFDKFTDRRNGMLISINALETHLEWKDKEISALEAKIKTMWGAFTIVSGVFLVGVGYLTRLLGWW